MASSVFSRTTRRRPTARLLLPSRTSLGLCGCWAHRKGWREGLLGTPSLCGEAKSKLCPELVSDGDCSAARPSLAYANFAFFEVSLIDDVLYSPGWGGPRRIAGRLLARVGFHAAPRSPRHRQRRCLPSLALRKAVFYQRTAGSSSAKESQEAPRE
jgi:hypothetical protein